MAKKKEGKVENMERVLKKTQTSRILPSAMNILGISFKC